MLNSHHHAAAAAANMYPWYRDSMSQLGQFCGAAAAHGANIKTENGYNDCMLALDYAQTKVGHFNVRLQFFGEVGIVSNGSKTSELYLSVILCIISE